MLEFIQLPKYTSNVTTSNKRTKLTKEKKERKKEL